MTTPILALLLLLLHLLTCTHAATVSPSSPRRWDTLTLSFQGPSLSERGLPNPFLDFRLDVLFTHPPSAASFLVPGFYAADGDAAHSAADSGNVWCVRFTPSRTGNWTYTAVFKAGADVAVDPDAGEGKHFDGDAGHFNVAEADAQDPDLRAKGRLQYVGQRYYRFANGEYKLKLGTNSPENLLGYRDFDASSGRLAYDAHVADWQDGDPTWRDGRGKGLIGALNYLAASRVNSLFAILMTVKGDADGDVHPWVSPDSPTRFDVSRLEQWRIVFDHASRLGLTLNLAFLETENEALFEHDAGLSTATGFANTRKLFYREMIARFAHQLGCTLTLGEENGWSEAEENGGGMPWGAGNTLVQREMFTQFIRDTDAYNSPMAVHTFPSDKEMVYAPMLGARSAARVEGASLQMSRKGLTANDTLEWISRSTRAGLPWVVTADEFGSDEQEQVGGVPLGDEKLNTSVRAAFAWGHFLAGGAGLEVYSGPGDQSLEDFRELEQAWGEFSRPIVLMEKHGLPFWAMTGANDVVARRTGDGEDFYTWGFARIGEVYVVYATHATDVIVDLKGAEGRFEVRWFDPRRDETEELLMGSVESVDGGKKRWVGMPPDEDGDWVVVVSRAVPKRRERLTTVSAHDLIPGAVTMGANEGRWGR